MGSRSCIKEPILNMSRSYKGNLWWFTTQWLDFGLGHFSDRVVFCLQAAAGKCQEKWRERSTARVTAKIRPELLPPNPGILLFTDTSGRSIISQLHFLSTLFFWRNEAKLFPHRNTCCAKRLPQIFCEMWQKNNFQFLLHHTAATFLTAFLLFFPADTEYTLTTSSFKKAKQIKTRPSKLCET